MSGFGVNECSVWLANLDRLSGFSQAHPSLKVSEELAFLMPSESQGSTRFLSNRVGPHLDLKATRSHVSPILQT